MKFLLQLTTCSLMSLSLLACSKDSKQETVQDVDPVLVKVGTQTITEKDLDIAVLRLLGPSRMAQIDDVARKKILESLVLSRVISQAAEAEINAETKDSIERKVRSYREEILVKQYLRDHVEPQPVTQGMVKAHYEKYPERYGAVVTQTFQLLSATKKLKGEARQKLLKALGGAEKAKDLKVFSRKLKAQNFAVTLRQGKSNDQLLQTHLKQVLSDLKLNQTSRVFFIDGVPSVVRVTAEKKQQARPLSEVSSSIRKALLPGQLKIAIKEVADKLKDKHKIEYIKK